MTEVGILQHPSEVKQAKGTAKLAHLCLPNSKLWVGECVAEIPELQAWLANKTTFLLYPDESISSKNTDDKLSDAAVSEDNEISPFTAASLNAENVQILVLDGTWRKTFKLLQLNPALQSLPRFLLTGELASLYSIRKTNKAGSLSTFEAITYALQQLHTQQDFSTLQTVFSQFIKQQQSWLPAKKST